MERLLKAQKLAAADVERGVTMDMVKKTRQAKHARVEQDLEQDVTKEVSVPVTDSKKDAIDHLLATIDATEAFENQLRAKYNL